MHKDQSQKGSCRASVCSCWLKHFEEIFKKICSHTSISIFGNAFLFLFILEMHFYIGCIQSQVVGSLFSSRH